MRRDFLQSWLIKAEKNTRNKYCIGCLQDWGSTPHRSINLGSCYNIESSKFVYAPSASVRGLTMGK